MSLSKVAAPASPLIGRATLRRPGEPGRFALLRRPPPPEATGLPQMCYPMGISAGCPLSHISDPATHVPSVAPPFLAESALQLPLLAPNHEIDQGKMERGHHHGRGRAQKK